MIVLATLAFGTALLATDASPATLTLDGIALGTDAKTLLAAHKNATESKTSAGSAWSWRALDGGVLKVTAGDDGNVAIVDYVAPKSASAKVDLPAATAFPLNSTHDKYSDVSSYMESDACAQTPPAGESCYAYTLSDSSELLLTFEASGGGPLREALWGDRELFKQLGLISAGTSL